MHTWIQPCTEKTERRNQLRSEGGGEWEGKKEEEEEEEGYCDVLFYGRQRFGKTTKEFPTPFLPPSFRFQFSLRKILCGLSLRFHPSLFILAPLRALRHWCVIPAIFPFFRFRNGRKLCFFHTLLFFPCWPSIDYLWQQSLFFASTPLQPPPPTVRPLALCFSFSHLLHLFSRWDFPLFLFLSLSGAAPAVWEQIALLLLGFWRANEAPSHLWASGGAT